MNQTLPVLESVCKIYAPNFSDGPIEAIPEDFDNLVEETAISYEDAAKIG
jgi:hypothetical protein